MPLKILGFLFLFEISTLCTNAQTWQDTTLIIDKVLSRYTDSIPGAQLAISRNGQIIYSNARGAANLEYGVPLTKISKIEAGSVSKQFTSACILLLEQQGRLSQSDDIRKYVPEVPEYGNIITIRHLLHHTSGLKDWSNIAILTGWPRWSKAYNNNDALQIISQQTTLNNQPGDEFIYSNSNFNLLTIIIQRISGMSLAEFSKKFIFIPAGMTNTEWRDDYQRVVHNRATAYSKSGNSYSTFMPNENAYGNGGLLTTAEDLLRWNNYYISGKFGSPSLFSEQTKTIRLNNGRLNRYAPGLYVDSTGKWIHIWHSGATAGYRSHLEYFPQLGLSIAWLSNSSDPDFSNIRIKVRDLFLKYNEAEQIKPDSTIILTYFTPYMGTYRNSKTGAGFKLVIKKTGIYDDPGNFLLQPINKNTLSNGQERIILLSANPRKAIYITTTGDSILYTGIDSARLDNKMMDEYSGNYFSDETGTTAKIIVRKDGLFLHLKSDKELLLQPVYRDGFYSLVFYETFNETVYIYFERNQKNIITHFYASDPRARNIKFYRKK
jgi:CubicO group peptidase (beta-lactamase class C family)